MDRKHFSNMFICLWFAVFLWNSWVDGSSLEMCPGSKNPYIIKTDVGDTATAILCVQGDKEMQLHHFVKVIFQGYTNLWVGRGNVNNKLQLNVTWPSVTEYCYDYRHYCAHVNIQFKVSSRYMNKTMTIRVHNEPFSHSDFVAFNLIIQPREPPDTGNPTPGNPLGGTEGNNCDQDWSFVHGYCVKLFPKATFTAATSTCQKHISVMVANVTVLKQILTELLQETESVKGMWLPQRKGNLCSFYKLSLNGTREINCTKKRKFVCGKPPIGASSTQGKEPDTASPVTPETTPPAASVTTPSTSTTSTTRNTTTTTTHVITNTATSPTTTTATATTPTTTTITTSTATTTTTTPVITTTASTTTTTIAGLQPSCPELDRSRCPENWYPVGDKCIMINRTSVGYYTANRHCTGFGASLLRRPVDSSIRACVYHELGGKSISDARIWLDNGRQNQILDVSTNYVTRSYYTNSHPFACALTQTDWNISIKRYGLTVNGTRAELLTLFWSGRSFDAVKRGDELHFHCEAEGIPTPHIKIQLGDHNVGYQKKARASECGNVGNFTCVASNVFETVSRSKMINSKCESKIKDLVVKPKYIRAGDDVSVTCKTEGFPVPIVKIVRTDTGNIMAETYHSQPEGLTFDWNNFQCQDMGTTYECQVGRDGGISDRRSVDLWPDDCPPVLCKTEDSHKTIVAAVGDTVMFSLCVVAYPGIRETMYFNDTWATARQARKGFTWTYQRLTNHSDHILNVTVTLTDIKPESYGELRLRLRIRRKTSLAYQLEYIVSLKAQGPPACPDNITVTHQGHDNMELSWQPEFDGGAIQSFHVYYRSDNATWERSPETQKTSTSISDLKEDTVYTLRVIAVNRFSKNVDEKTCEMEIHQITGKRPPIDNLQQSQGEESPSSSAVSIVVPVVLCLIVVAVIVGFVVYKKRGVLLAVLRPSGREAPPPDGSPDPDTDDQQANVYANVSSVKALNGSGADNTPQMTQMDNEMSSFSADEDSGRYFSEEGLVYLTVAHLNSAKKSRKKKPKRSNAKPDKNDTVEYVTLDFEKSGKFPIPEENEEGEAGDGQEGVKATEQVGEKGRRG